MISLLHTAHLSNKKVFLRADLNVPLSDGHILDDYRLKCLQPTLDLLIKDQAKIILATHIGRPTGYTKELSTRHLLTWFTHHGYRVTFAASLQDAEHLSHDMAPGTILLLENLRFCAEERAGSPHDQQIYAEHLRSLAEYYVNDAWAVLHEKDVSVTLLPQLFTHKTIGLLVEQEIAHLSKLLTPRRPYVMFLGGGKLSKISFIKHALTIADTVVVLPGLAFTFLKAQGIVIGDSLVDETLLSEAEDILAYAKDNAYNLIMPQDFLVGSVDLKGPLSVSSTLRSGQMGISVGPRSLEQYIALINNSQTVFYNGAMGFFERPETLEPLKKLLQAIAQANTYSVVGGGESVAAVHLFALSGISFCSSGGGATLRYLTYGTLPDLRYY